MSESLVVLAERIRARKISALEVAESHLARIEALDPRIHAWETVEKEQVLGEARKLDAQIASGPRGPLHGVPIGIKDIFRTAGLRTTFGSPLYRDHVPTIDCEVVARLRAAGAVILGKTVTTAFATLDPGPTRNPWNPAHTPGGSSSGSAAAVASRMCLAATATQTAGSLGRPAAYCGVAGILPAQARLSRHGIFPVATSLDRVGVLAGNLEDAALVLAAMTGDERPIPEPRRPERVGVLTGILEMRELGRVGLECVEMDPPPSFALCHGILGTIMAVECAAVHETRYRAQPEQYPPKIRELIETGLGTSAPEYVRALEARSIYQEEMRGLFREVNCVISPGAPGPAPEGLDSTGSPAFQVPWTLADLPTLSLPLGLDASGLPLGVQLSGPPGDEAGLLGAGLWLEGRIAFSPPRVPDGQVA